MRKGAACLPGCAICAIQIMRDVAYDTLAHNVCADEVNRRTPQADHGRRDHKIAPADGARRYFQLPMKRIGMVHAELGNPNTMSSADLCLTAPPTVVVT